MTWSDCCGDRKKVRGVVGALEAHVHVEVRLRIDLGLGETEVVADRHIPLGCRCEVGRTVSDLELDVRNIGH